jgi:hypothetical protein
MADDIDLTQDRLEAQEMIRRKYAPEDVSIEGDGACLNCGNDISKDKRWFDKECADDWEYMSRRSGK